MGKFEEIAYELKKTWNYLTREELCDYFGISDRSLYRYQSKLELTKETQKPLKANQTVPIYINTPDNKVKKQTFKSWQHFVVWAKAQSHPFVISDGNVINMDYKRTTDEARKFLKTL